MKSLEHYVADALEDVNIHVQVNGPTFAKAMRVARFAVNREVEPETAARWAAIRVTQSVCLRDRAKLV